MLSNMQSNYQNPFNIAPNESLTWFCIRQKLWLTQASNIESVRKNNKSWEVAMFPRKLDLFQPSEISLDLLLMRHTALPILNITSKAELKYSIVQYWRGKAEHRVIFGNMKPSLKWSKILFCPLCLREQIKNYGFAWFLREWQIPLVTCCVKHNKLLVQLRCDCSLTDLTIKDAIRASLTGYCDKCKVNVWVPSTSKPTSRQRVISRWIGSFIEHESLFISNAVHRSIFHDVLEMHRISSNDSKHAIKRISRTFFKRYGRLGKDKVISQLKLMLSGVSTPIEPEVFFILIIACFSSAEEFTNYLHTHGNIAYVRDVDFSKDVNPYPNSGISFFDALDFEDERPSDFGLGGWLRVIL